MGTPPARYPVKMYNAVSGGIQRWKSAVHPPLPRAMRLANLHVASFFRNFWDISADHPLNSFRPSMVSGWTGLCSALPTMVRSFMSTYHHQLNHPNLHVQASTRHALLQAFTRFHPNMLCLARGVPHACAAHSDDHSLFILWGDKLSIQVHVSRHDLDLPLLSCPLYKELTLLEGCICSATPFHFSMPPPYAVFIQDASCFPTGRQSGGAVAMLAVVTGHYTLHRIPNPVCCDNSYQADLYVALVVLRSRAQARWYLRDARWSLTESKSYIPALGFRNDGASGHFPFGCRLLVQNTAPPQHLYSHLAGTFRDRVMHAVDGLAQEEGLGQVPRYGWIPKLQQLPVIFIHCDRQVQEVQALLDKKVPPCVHAALGVPYSPPSCSHEQVVMRACVKWDIHLRIVASDRVCIHPASLPRAACAEPQ